MGFTTSSKNIHLRPIKTAAGDYITNLCADCKDENGKWNYREVTLDWYIGVDQPTGRFLLGSPLLGSLLQSKYLTKYSTKVELTAGGAVLLCTMDASYNRRLNTLALDMIFHNDKGDLVYQLPPKNVRSRLTHLTLRGPAVLHGFAFTRYGTLTPTSLDLDQHLTNDNGLLKRRKNGNFSHSAIDLGLNSNWALIGQLEDWHHTWHLINCWQLMDEWVSITDEGELVMEDPVGTWDLRGPFFRLLEEIPVIGYIVAGIDELEGDHDEAVRAAAECTYATICLAAALVGGALLGPVGAAVASGVAGYAGLYAKRAIGQHISNPTMRNEVTAITIYRVLVAELTLIAGVGLEGLSGAFSELIVEELMADGFGQLAVSMGKMLSEKGLESLSEYDMETIVKNLVDAIQHGKSEDDIKHMFDDWENDGVDLLNDPTPKKDAHPPPRPRPSPPTDEDTNVETGTENYVYPRDPAPHPIVDDGTGWDESGGGTALGRKKKKMRDQLGRGGWLTSTADSETTSLARITSQLESVSLGTSYTLILNGDGLQATKSNHQEFVFRLEMSRLLAGLNSPNSGEANTNINFYDDDGYRLCLHVSFRPSTNVLHISQWWDGSWRNAWWAPFSTVFANMQQGRDGWLRIVRNTDFFYDFETFNLDDHNERVHGATWSVRAAAWKVQSVKYAGSPSLFGERIEVHI
ncbi:hypothetical protein BDV36DRAFT_293656 [Aspergillus pseudocaelatus]|uniref:Cyanovirin-N domain-containing protein n=1 Tax=Aspergillus pseudocaelatus TaxID=1825620 RepID=A0ABQ6WUR3_9EURO|nr:hypothetical protein BDV36DRAFT_293656 [Aspergillus pseudocaelatus]